ncbi:hypothetical protein BH11ACT2_BH11ACT2_20520 [soil metagenome]
MPSSSASAFALASTLRGRSDDDLALTLRLREVREAGIKDFFDLAEKLLERSSVQSALSRIDRRSLLTLSVICELGAHGDAVSLDAVTARIREVDHPRALALPTTVEGRARRMADRALLALDPNGYIALSPVCEQLAAWPSLKLPTLAELARALPERLGEMGHVDQDATDSLAAERAFGTTMAIVELLAEVERDSARELARGGLGGPDLKRLAAVNGMNVNDIPLLVGVAQAAGLLELDDGRWSPSDKATAWGLHSLADRWADLASGWLSPLAEDTRFILTDRAHAVWGAHFEDFISWLYPAADASFRALIDRQIAASELLGITADHSPSTAGSALLARGPQAGRTAMADLLPPEVESVYVQHDLSIVSPGPLAPQIDARLRSFASVESRALASTFRISAASITRALATGDTEESILRFLGEISLTGIPQPVGYLITETAGRYALLRVGKALRPDAHTQSFVETQDNELLETLLVDRRLSPLGLRRTVEGTATSRFDRDVVYLALLDARYPAAAIDESGAIEIVERHAHPRDAAGTGSTRTHDPVAAIIEKLRLSATATAVESDTAWLERQLELAIKSKLSVTVSVTMPDGTLQDYTLEPTGLSSGRLRARDRKADIERTLPLSRIAMIGGEHAHPSAP